MDKEYRFKIEAYTPDTFPMARCADYLNELANMVGEMSYVHFMRLESGCVAINYRVESPAVPKVTERMAAVKDGRGSVREMSAYRKINDMLREDNGKGSVADGDCEIINFPGREGERIKLVTVKEYGKADGEVIRIGGSKDPVPIMLEVEGQEITGFVAKRDLAKKLAKYLFEPVRLHGEGQWEREDTGNWVLKKFRVDRFEVLPGESLTETVIALRSMKGDWDENALQDILNDRYSDGEGGNGGRF